MQKLLIVILIGSFGFLACKSTKEPKRILDSDKIIISKDTYMDKIKGGWAGQTIGVIFGTPYEFRFQGTFIGDYQSLEWDDGYLKKTMLDFPGAYDDLYMDLTFVDVFENSR